MMIVNSTNVHFLKSTANAVSSAPKLLEYFSNLYELIATFSISQKSQATELWCQLTDHSNTICLLVHEVDAYSIWGLTDQKIDDQENDLIDTPPETASELMDISLWLGRSLWLIVADLAGFDRAQLFEIDVLNSTLPLPAGSNLQVHQPIECSLDEYVKFKKSTEINSIMVEFQQIVARYLGSSCASQIMQDILASIPAELSLNA